jgi:hypothetical protein
MVTERQKYRKTEIPRDRNTERQKYRKTVRQKDRKTERQKGFNLNDGFCLKRDNEEVNFSVAH